MKKKRPLRAIPEEIIYWHNLLLELKSSGKSIAKFAHEKNINEFDINNKRYRLEYKKYSEPQWYKKTLPLVREFMNEDLSAKEFSDLYGIKEGVLNDFVLHLQYIDIVESQKNSTENPQEYQPNSPMEKMKFIQAPMQKPPDEKKSIEPTSTHQVVEVQKHTIELKIQQGITVTVSSEITSETILKIINFLKEISC